MAYSFTIRNLSVVKQVRDPVMLIHVGKFVGASNAYKVFNIPKQPTPAVLMMAALPSKPRVRIDDMKFEGKRSAWLIC